MQIQEKLIIIGIVVIVVVTFLITTIFTDIYYYYTMKGSFSLENVFRPNWGLSVFSDIVSLSGLTLAVGTHMFYLMIIGQTSSMFYPGGLFLVASWISIPIMITLTRGIQKWRRILYIYLACTQLSAPILVYWTKFGA